MPGIANVSTGALFMSGIVPGILLGVAMMLVVVFYSKRKNFPQSPRVPVKTAIVHTLKSLPALMTPIILIGGIVSGLFTPTESAAFACIYALIVGIFFYRSIKVSRLPAILIETMKMASLSLFALATANALGELLSYSGTAIPAENHPWSGEASGEYGSCSWALQHGVLTISGSVVPNFSTAGGKQAPWAPMAALIREVHLTEDVSSIGDYAFWGCGELSTVKLSAGINYIGAYAFGACQSLAHFDFPTALDTIGEGAFSLCSALTEAELPVGLVHIDDDAFQMCTSLQRISIPASVTEIGSGALSFGGEEPAEIIAPAGSYAEQWVKDNL